MTSDQLQRICHGHNFGHISLDSTVGLTAHPFTDYRLLPKLVLKKWFAFRCLDDQPGWTLRLLFAAQPWLEILKFEVTSYRNK